jgi:hypothetical protein
MSQQYRHIIAANPDRLICNHNLFDVAAPLLSVGEAKALVAVLNSTLVGLFKTFYGRFAGTEGNLKTEVVDVNLLEVPDPRGISAALAARLKDALPRMSKREVGRLVEEQLMECHSPERAAKLAAMPLVYSQELHQPDRRDLDDAVFELLGVTKPKEREYLVGRLYDATACHFREIRVVEIQKMQQRARSEGKRFGVHDLAADIWDAAELEELKPLAEWVSRRPESDATMIIPEERPAVVKLNPLFREAAVFFGRGGRRSLDCQSDEQAKLVARLATFGVIGELKVPQSEQACSRLLELVDSRMGAARSKFEELAASRTGDERVRGQLLDALMRWFVAGRAQERGPGAVNLQPL